MKKRFKLRYRILILTVIFLGALYYFSGNYLVVRNFELSTDTTEMAEAALPNISLMVGDEEINRLYGYTSNLDWTLNRETITPIGKDKTFQVRIEENRMTVRRLKYELFDVASGALLDSGTISALTSEKEEAAESKDNKVKTAKIKLNAELNEGTEYSVKITLVTSNSKRVYYYTRVKQYTNGYLSEKLDYVRWFRESALQKINQEAVEKNLETKSNSDTSSFAHTDIYSSWEMVSWGDLQPQMITELPPTITDFYEGTASVVLSYVVQMDTGSGTEQFMVREAFRFLYTEIRTYLYNYEREVEAIYDVERTSIAKDDLKLGITADTGMEIFSTANSAFTAFVRNRELWSYDRKENEMTRVFSFRSEDAVDLMELYDAHDVKLLALKQNGDMDFLVYGYMNRGEYEGRVGIVLYRYFHEEKRLEEQMYIPINTTYQLLKGEVNEFAYMNSYDVLYFTIYNAIYSYNLTTRTLQQLAADVPPKAVVFLKEFKHVVWQGDGDTESGKLTVLDLETGAMSRITAGAEEQICLLGKIDTNLVYGYARKSDVVRNYDGTRIVPMYRVVIADLKGTIFKEYSQQGYYVTEAEFEDNVIYLTRVKRADTPQLRYLAAPSDAIQNRTTVTTPSVYITGRVTELAKTEYYITFPGDVVIDKIPEVKTVPLTVLSADPTVRITPADNLPEQYMTYSFGRVVICTESVVDAIERANEDENVGAVIDSKGKVVWERGVKANRSSISGISPVASLGTDGLQTALELVFSYEGFDIDTSQIVFESKEVADWLEQYLKVSALELKGASLDEVLYYVYKKYPVISILSENKVWLIVGYDQTSIEVIDPVFGTTQRIEKEQAEKLLEDSGNVFYSYID